MTEDGRAGSGGERLVPCLDMPRRDAFVGTKTGKSYSRGYLVYIGVDVGVDDLFKKAGKTNPISSADRMVLESFLQQLQDLKIGNVVSLAFLTNDACQLQKKAEHPVLETPKYRLPE